MTLDMSTITVHPAFAVGTVDPRVFGGFLEHLGRAVYQGVYQPDSVHADEYGCRTDVLAALGRLGMTTMRWPGGNFVSGYHWHDGVGPVEARPTVREAAWKSVEPNAFGTHEFLDLAERMGWTPMVAVNLGTGGPEEAADWVEYCNGPVGTRWADERAANGRVDPWRVPLWCLGNEMDGPWQLGHVPAEVYARRAQQAAMQMKLVDPAVQTVVCGSSLLESPTYGSWDRQVLEIVGDKGDLISLHRYAGNLAGDIEDYLATGVGIDRQIRAMDAVCRAAQATARSPRRVRLCFDEWNVWYRNFDMDGAWTRAPHLLEEVYDLADALVCAQFLMSFIRHADVVKVANLAQVVNVIAPVLTKGDDLLVQAIYHPFRMISDRRTGTSLRVVVDGPELRTRSHGVVAVVDAAVIADDGHLQVFAVNRSASEAAAVKVVVPGDRIVRGTGELLTSSSLSVANSWEAPDALVPVPIEVAATDGAATVELPPHSFLAATLPLASAGAA